MLLVVFGVGYLASRGFAWVVVVCFGLGSECVVGVFVFMWNGAGC